MSLDLSAATLTLDQAGSWDALTLEVAWFDGNAAVAAELDPSRDAFDISGLAPAYTGTVLQSAVYSDALRLTVTGERSDGTSCITTTDAAMLPLTGTADDGWVPPAGAGLSGSLALDPDAVEDLSGGGVIETDSLTLRVDNGKMPDNVDKGSLNREDSVTGRAYLHFPFTGDIPLMPSAFNGAYIEFVPDEVYPGGADSGYTLVDARMSGGQGYAVFQGYPGYGQTSHGVSWTFRDGYDHGSGQDLEENIHNGMLIDPSRGKLWALGWQEVQSDVEQYVSTLVEYDLLQDGVTADVDSRTVVLNSTEVFRSPDHGPAPLQYFNSLDESAREAGHTCLTQRMYDGLDADLVACIPKGDGLRVEEMLVFTNPGYEEDWMPADFSSRYPDAQIIPVAPPDDIAGTWAQLFDGIHQASIIQGAPDEAVLVAHSLVDTGATDGDPLSPNVTHIIDLTRDSAAAPWTATHRCSASAGFHEAFHGDFIPVRTLGGEEIAFAVLSISQNALTYYRFDDCTLLSELNSATMEREPDGEDAPAHTEGLWAHELPMADALASPEQSGVINPYFRLDIAAIARDTEAAGY